MFKKMPKNLVLLAVIIVGLAIAGAIVFVNFQKCPGSKTKGKILSSQEAGKKVVDFINQKMLRGQAVASLVSTTEEKESGLYKVTINLQGKDIVAYATLDGKFLYPERINMDKETAQGAEKNSSTSKKTCATIKKSDKPLMDVFVVSSCPFGLQTQRVLAEIWKNTPSLLDSVKVRYIGSISNGKIISMHGDKEAQENLKQICIREEQPSKYWNYISCYIKKGDSNGCLNVAKIDAGKLNKCETDSSRGLKYAKEDFDLQDKYKVSGSPTLILNGERVNEFDFGGRTAEAEKTLLCCGFNSSPDSCSKKLTTDSAATGLSGEYSSKTAGSGGGGCQ
jgi:hypothetical protein